MSITPSDCALDLEAGLNYMGWPPDEATELKILRTGGSVVMPCPSCARAGRPHVLVVRMAPVAGDSDSYVVTDAA
jgi:hypothetical protein